jgi:hypothetical protein
MEFSIHKPHNDLHDNTFLWYILTYSIFFHSSLIKEKLSRNNLRYEQGPAKSTNIELGEWPYPKKKPYPVTDLSLPHSLSPLTPSLFFWPWFPSRLGSPLTYFPTAARPGPAAMSPMDPRPRPTHVWGLQSPRLCPAPVSRWIGTV